MRTGRWREHDNVRRGSNRRTEWRTISTERLRNLQQLPSTQTSAPCITTERWTPPSGTPQCTTHLNTITAHDLTAQHMTAELPRTGGGHCRTECNVAMLRQPTAPQLSEDLPAFYGSRRLSLSSARLIQSRPSILFLYRCSGECYNGQFLSIKSECYNERGGILLADTSRAYACVGPSRFD
jgi:hypothetical protein